MDESYGPSRVWTCRECGQAQMSKTGYVPIGELCDGCLRKALREIEDELTDAEANQE